MDIPTQTELLDRIEVFCGRHDIAETRFGREAVNNPAFLRGLREGKSPTLETLNKLKEFMARTDADAALRAKLSAAPPPSEPEEVEQPLPFSSAPVNPTGASSPTSSSTNAPQRTSAGSDSCRSTAADHGAGMLAARPATPTAAREASRSCSGDEPTGRKTLFERMSDLARGESAK